jgi:dTDP-4-amino-4,6-dideoxygalactose transaminase
MTANQNVPFLDMASLDQELEKELVSFLERSLRTAGFIGGPMVEESKSGFAHFCEIAHCVGVSSGTEAVRFALMAAGVQPCDIVLTCL